MVNFTATSSTDDVHCIPLAIKQFPPDIFSAYQLEHGVILLHFGAAFYVFGALAYLCNNFFVPTLEYIVDRFKIKPDVAGATVMAIGGSLPELFTSLIGVFVAQDDIGLGAIVGSSLFNSLLVISLYVLVAPRGSMNLEVYPVMRDSLYYVIALISLTTVSWDQEVTWYDALILVSMYCGFILVIYLNLNIKSRLNRCCQYFVSRPLIYPHEHEKLPILPHHSGLWMRANIDVDDKLSGSNSFSPISFGGNQVGNQGNAVCPTHFSRTSSRNSKEAEISFIDDNPGNEVKTGFEDAEINSWCYQFSLPDGTFNKMLWVIGFPIIVIFAFTIPNPRQDCCRKLFPVTIIMSLLYIGALSYLLVWMVAVIGYTIGIPDIILGLIFLSAGSSVPDALGSIIVSRHRKGNMAVSNCIGSNVFDVLIGLGLPWLLKTTVSGTSVKIYSGSIHFIILILTGSVIIVNIVFIVSKWSPRWPSGLALLILYAGLITLACLFEMNVLGKYNLLTCALSANA